MSLRAKLERDEQKDKVRRELYENHICSAVGKQLMSHYPGWKWYVECHLHSGMISVRNVSLHGDYGFYIGISDFLTETNPKLVMRAGGELLERFHLQAKGRSGNEIIKRDFTGGAIGDLNATN